jgi:hypothetical protein
MGSHISPLLIKQQQFSIMIAKMIVWAYEHDYTITLGEAYRTPEQAELNAKKGIGIANSLHTLRLAMDLNVFRHGIWLTHSMDLAELGLEWERMGGTWGGRFKKPDGNHFSLEYDGVA